MFRIARCDDELIFAEELKELISGYMTEKRSCIDVTDIKYDAFDNVIIIEKMTTAIPMTLDGGLRYPIKQFSYEICQKHKVIIRYNGKGVKTHG